MIRKVPARKNGGVPIGGYLLDAQNHSYVVRCQDLLSLGHLPVCYKLSIKGYDNWSVEVPLPEAVIRRYLSEDQKSVLKDFMGAFNAEEVNFEFLQLLSSL